MHLFEVRATVNGARVPTFYVYATDENDARIEAMTILGAMLNATGIKSAPFGRVSGYEIEIEET